MANITVRVALDITAPPERVWDFSQDWSRRSQWDATVISAEAIEGRDGAPAYRVIGAGGLKFVARYKLYEKPRRTSLEMAESNSSIVTGGGGSWAYESKGDQTIWTQTNTLTLRNGLIGWLLTPLVRWRLGYETRRAMKRAKKLIENQ
jgi:hypothetical protein